MTSFRLKQIGLALCLMASLLTASPAACTCSHHEESKVTDADCHSHHETADTTQAANDLDVVDDDCICVIDQREPYVASKSESKELKVLDTLSKPEQIASIPEFVAVAKHSFATRVFAHNLFYSTIFKSLLPSRAPPHL